MIPASKNDIESWGVDENAVSVPARWLPGPVQGQHFQKQISGAWPARIVGMSEMMAYLKPGKVI